VNRRESGGEQEHGKLASVKELRKQQKTKNKKQKNNKQATYFMQYKQIHAKTEQLKCERNTNKRANETNREGCVTMKSTQKMNFYDRLVSCNVQNQNKVMQQG